MFRLILLTVAALFGLLALYGTPELAEHRPAMPTAAADAAVLPESVTLAAARSTAPAQPAAPAAAELAAAALRASTSTGPAFAGPTLKPSPEYGTRMAAAQAAPTGSMLYVAANRINLRQSAAGDAQVIAGLARGTALTPVGDTTGAWVEVQTDAGQRGFVSAKYLSPRRPG